MGVALDYEPQNGLHSSYRSDEARNLVLAARKETDDAKRAEALHRAAADREPRLPVHLHRRAGAASTPRPPRSSASNPNSQGKYNFENVYLSK